MKQLNFTYIKQTGEVSERKLLVIKEPDNKYHGIDISEAEISSDDLNWLSTYLDKINTSLEIVKTEALKDALNLLKVDYKYRSFFEKNMLNVEQVDLSGSLV